MINSQINYTYINLYLTLLVYFHKKEQLLRIQNLSHNQKEMLLYHTATLLLFMLCANVGNASTDIEKVEARLDQLIERYEHAELQRIELTDRITNLESMLSKFSYLTFVVFCPSPLPV